jgi:hypothetical protein
MAGACHNKCVSWELGGAARVQQGEHDRGHCPAASGWRDARGGPERARAATRRGCGVARWQGAAAAVRDVRGRALNKAGRAK